MVVVGFPVGLPRSWASFQDSEDYNHPAGPGVYYCTGFDRPVKEGDRVFIYETDGAAGLDSFGYVGMAISTPAANGLTRVKIDPSIVYQSRDWADCPEVAPNGWRGHFPERWECEHMSISGAMSSAWCDSCHGLMQPVG